MRRILTAPLALVLACASVGLDDEEAVARCPPPNGEFPPTACARIAGSLVGSVGEVLRYYVSVDSRDTITGTWFVASPVAVRADGVFALLVAQVDPLGRSVSRDSAMVDLLIHDGEAAVRNRSTPLVAHRVTVRLAALGAEVETTRVEVRLPARP